MKSSGYSGTPLTKKLGYKEGFKVRVVNQPEHYFDLLPDLPASVEFLDDIRSKKDLIHYFSIDAKELEREILSLRKEIVTNGIIWISWPKKSAKIATTITEDTIRNLALANGLVDVKVCAVDDVWSGLKLVIPVKERKTK
jgi:hypothetical protein